MIAELLLLAADLAAILVIMLAVYGVGHRRGFRSAIDMVDAEITRRFSPKD